MRGYRIADWVELLPGGAAVLTEGNVLVVADMHLGCEAALEYEGLSLPRVQTKKITEYMEMVISEVEPAKVIVAGDLKHNFSRNLNQEWQDVNRFVALLEGKARLEVVKGNHDNYLGSILAQYKTKLQREIVDGGVLVTHGHYGSRTGRPTVMGHIHPSIRLKDSVGASVKDQCFLYSSETNILILPALSIVAPGFDVVSQREADTASPLYEDVGLAGFVPVVFSGERALRFPNVGELRQAE